MSERFADTFVFLALLSQQDRSHASGFAARGV